MQLTDQQRKELYQATAAAYNHHGRRPFRVLRETRKTLRVEFGWQETMVTLIAQVIVKLIEKWMAGDLTAIDPHHTPDDFCVGNVSDQWDDA